MLNAKLKNISECFCKSKVHKMYLLRASASQKGLKGKKYETLSSSSKNFERDTYKVGRRPKAAVPLCMSSLSQIVQTGN